MRELFWSKAYVAMQRVVYTWLNKPTRIYPSGYGPSIFAQRWRNFI